MTDALPFNFDAILTNKELIFCKTYLVDLNARNAVQEAGYSCTAPSGNDRRSDVASKLLKKPHIKAYIKRALESRMKKIDIDSDYVLRELKDIRELDVADIMEPDGTTIKNVHDWPKTWRINISALDATEIIAGNIKSIIKKLKIPDKLKTLELIGKHIKVSAFTADEANEVIIHSKVEVVIDEESYDGVAEEPVLVAKEETEDFNFL